ncbi:MAG: CRISPR-associated helicase Cas3' [Ignavibacteriaceae bacterium]|nr:CRISPR-associated helicase Cas3' [Ignavibacteriaceae bacterium]
MLKFFEILDGSEFSILLNLKNRDDYFAHLKDGKTESLFEHTSLVLEYFLRLIDQNELEIIIDRLIVKDVDKVDTKRKSELQNLVKQMFVAVIYFHDIGKVNPNFQIDKMKNRVFAHAENGIGSEHSILSAYLYLSFFLNLFQKGNFGEEEIVYLELIAILFFHSISKHHSELSEALEPKYNESLANNLDNYFCLFGDNYFIDKKEIKNIFAKTEEYRNYKEGYTDEFAGYLLLKLNSSLLTASDYYATNEFMNNLKITDLGIINEVLKDKIITNTYKVSYNNELLRHFDYYKSLSVGELNEFSENNIKLLRQKLSAEVIQNIQSNISQRLFYIEAPTGSGKTNLSLLAVSEIVKNREDILKIFYVFPFTTIITQTFKTLKESLKLNYLEISEIHSKASFKENTSIANENDATYDTDWKNYIDNLFVNYPIVLLSHVKFFDLLISNEKSDNYVLHRLANSVVIIDELQSYDPKEWDKINYLLQKFAEAMNITFIIMSATLPKISKLLVDKDVSKDNFVYLVKNKIEYFSNPNFKERVNIQLEYLSEGKDLSNLCKIVFKHCEDYYNQYGSVKGIVGFLSKKSAKEFYSLITQSDDFYCYSEIYLLTGTILEPRRQEIISYLKSEETKYKKILVICTQVIEAGLDIDMDIGFKDKAILDSEEQFAGRINRNASKNNSSLFIFNTGDSSSIYNSDLRYKVLDEKLYRTIIDKRDYDILYENIFAEINKNTVDNFLSGNLVDFIKYLNFISYPNVKKNFCLIKNNTASVFVPCDIEKKHFNVSELKFLSSFVDKHANTNLIDGEAIWKIYECIILNKKSGFDSKIDLKIISAIMSKFVFSIWKNPKTVSSLLHRSDTGNFTYGFIKLSKSNYQDVYSYRSGLKVDLETDINFL